MEVAGAEFLDAPARSAVDGNLSSLVHLQHLHIRYVRGLCRATLPCLQLLTCLNVNGLSIENLLQLGALTSLQELHLRTSLEDAVGPSSAPGLVFPASLTKLVLWSDVEAGLLSLVTGLHELRVESGDIKGPAEGSGSLLCGMARLQHLTDLYLGGSELTWPPAGATYSALTASSNLVRMVLYNTFVAEGAWQHVFAGTRRLPHLTSLELSYYDRDGDWDASPYWDAADLSSLVSCCPSLCSIHTLPLRPGLHVSALHKLTALTQLYVDYDTWRYDRTRFIDSVRGLAAVAQLRSLHVTMFIPTMHAATLLPLTSLTALTNFYFSQCSQASWNMSTEVNTGGGSIHVGGMWLGTCERIASP